MNPRLSIRNRRQRFECPYNIAHCDLGRCGRGTCRGNHKGNHKGCPYRRHGAGGRHHKYAMDVP